MFRRIRSIALGGLAMTSLTLAAVGLQTGCSSDGASRNPNGSRMTRDQMLLHADDLMIQGRHLKEQGTITGDDAMAQHGETLLQEGRKLKEKAGAE